MRSISTIVILFLSCSFITACNTMEGVGKDIKAGGSKLEKSAHENKDCCN